MFVDPSSLMWLLLTVASSFVASLFLPSFIEIIKPRDKGPRRMLTVPLQKLMRQASKLAYSSKSDSVGDSNTQKDLKDLEDVLKVKIRRIGKDTIRILGGVVFPAGFEISDNIVVEGKLTVGTRCVFHGSVKAKGNVSVGNSVVIKKNLVSSGNVDVQDDAVVGGSVHAQGSVRLGEKVYIGLSIVTDGDVELFENSEVKDGILTHGAIKVRKHPKLSFPSSIEDID